MPTVNDHVTVDETRKIIAGFAVLNGWRAAHLQRAVGSASSPPPPDLLFLRGPELLVVKVTTTDAARKPLSDNIEGWFLDLVEHHCAEAVHAFPGNINTAIDRLMRPAA